MAGADDTTSRGNPFTRAWRRDQAARIRYVRRLLRSARMPAPADCSQWQPIAEQVRELAPRVITALRVGDECEADVLRLEKLNADARFYIEAAYPIEKPEIEHGKKFPAGRKPGSRGPLRHWLDRYAQHHPDASGTDVVRALLLDPDTERGDAAKTLFYCSRRVTYKTVKNEWSRTAKPYS